MGGIFISYRREDSAPYARLLSESLGSHFGPEQIFRDIDTIGPGQDFPEAIASAVGSCQVLLAVIGDKWLTAQSDGRRRLDNEGDYVRLEIAAALERDILVVPVLLEQARMPSKSELPPDLAELADRNAIRLTDDGWNDGIRRLATALEKPLGVAPAGTPPPPAASGWGPGTGTPSSWTKKPLPEPTRRPIRTGTGTGTGTGDGRTGSKRTGLIVGAVVVVVLLAGLSLLLVGGKGDGGGGDGNTDDTTEEPQSEDPSITLNTAVRPTIGRVTTDPGILRVETDLDISPTSGPVGTLVTVSGSGFAANERIDLRFHTTTVGETRTDEKGAFSGLRFRIPDTPFRNQQFDIVAVGVTSIRSARTPFQVT